MPDQFQSPVDAAGPLNVFSTPILSAVREAARTAGADTAPASATDAAVPAFKISRRVIRGLRSKCATRFLLGFNLMSMHLQFMAGSSRCHKREKTSIR